MSGGVVAVLESGDGRGRRLSGSDGGPGRAPEAPVLDLDVPPTETRPSLPSGERLRRRWHRIRTSRLPLPLVAVLFVAAGAVGGLTTRWWDLRQERVVRESTVSLVLLVPGSGAVSSGGGDGKTARMRGSLAVVNSGALPVEITRLHGTQDGFTIDNVDRSYEVRPGSRLIEVSLSVDCATRMRAEPLRVDMSVRTADGAVRPASFLVVVSGTPWSEQSELMCELQARVAAR